MSPDPRPSDNDIAQAAVLAARFLPGELRTRVELVAYAALREAYPNAQRKRLARQLGLDEHSNHAARIASARGSGWWSEDIIDQIVGALVGVEYGAQAQ